MDNNILDSLHKIASFLENNGNEDLAEEVHNIFVKVSAKKKKKSSGKNIPNNPSLWASCQAWAKANYDVHPLLIRMQEQLEGTSKKVVLGGRQNKWLLN